MRITRSVSKRLARPTSPLQAIPQDALHHIMDMLGPSDLGRLALTNKYLRQPATTRAQARIARAVQPGRAALDRMARQIAGTIFRAVVHVVRNQPAADDMFVTAAHLTPSLSVECIQRLSHPTDTCFLLRMYRNVNAPAHFSKVLCTRVVGDDVRLSVKPDPKLRHFPFAPVSAAEKALAKTLFQKGLKVYRDRPVRVSDVL